MVEHVAVEQFECSLGGIVIVTDGWGEGFFWSFGRHGGREENVPPRGWQMSLEY